MKLRAATIALFVVQTVAEFTPHFREFLINKYGDNVRQKLERLDLGVGFSGSFGGKLTDSDVINKRPIIFVHGVTGRALVFVRHRDYFLEKGYSSSELYATSYGDGGWTPFLETPIQCSFIRQIRRMIIAVYEYTGKKVDVIAWSMGSPITRKAILGGQCSENNRYFGKPITSLVETFVAVGGANYGIEHCPIHRNGCNLVNSMNCESTLMKELNSQPQRYEAANSFSLYSLTDLIIGQYCCGRICSDLANANVTYEKPNHNHLSILTETLSFQLELLNHRQ